MSSIKIAINALSALQGGGQTYLINLLRYAKDYKDMEFTVYCNPKFKGLFDLENVTAIGCDFASNGLIQRILWEKFVLPRTLKKEKIELIFCPGGILGFKAPSSCKTAVAFQNMLIFDEASRKKYSFGIKRMRLFILEMFSKKSFLKVDLIIFLSNYAKKVADSKVPYKKAKTVVIYHGIGKDAYEESDVIDKYKLKPKNYLLYVSYLHRIKLQGEVIDAFAMLKKARNTREKLLLVGNDCPPYGKTLKDKVKKLGIEEDVVFTGLLPCRQVQVLCKNSKANIFASICENCPNIVLEYLSAGRPIFLSNIMPMPEIAGNAAVYFNPNNPRELSDLLIRYLDDEEWEELMVQKARQRSLLYEWKETAEKTFLAFGEVIKEGVAQKK
jgi:glycosyltransferase involved in cell wall biosynthesis